MWGLQELDERQGNDKSSNQLAIFITIEYESYLNSPDEKAQHRKLIAFPIRMPAS